MHSESFGTADPVSHLAPPGAYTTHIENVSIGAGLMVVRFNGFSAAEQSAPSVVFTNEPNLGDGTFHGDLAEVIVYRRVLSPAERATVHTYLSTRHGVALADGIPPLAPVNLSATLVTPTSLTLHWSPASDNVGVVSYRIFLAGAELVSIPATANPTFLVSGRLPATSYSVTVMARDAAGNDSPLSSTVLVTTSATGDTPDTSAPSAPGGLGTVSAATTPNSVTLVWSASSDNVGIAAYLIYRNGVLVATVSGDATSHEVTGLSGQTAHSFTLVARDAAGNLSGSSLPTVVTTPPDTPAPLQYVTVPLAATGGVALNSLEPIKLTDSGYLLLRRRPMPFTSTNGSDSAIPLQAGYRWQAGVFSPLHRQTGGFTCFINSEDGSEWHHLNGRVAVKDINEAGDVVGTVGTDAQYPSGLTNVTGMSLFATPALWPASPHANPVLPTLLAVPTEVRRPPDYASAILYPSWGPDQLPFGPWILNDGRVYASYLPSDRVLGGTYGSQYIPTHHVEHSFGYVQTGRAPLISTLIDSETLLAISSNEQQWLVATSDERFPPATRKVNTVPATVAPAGAFTNLGFASSSPPTQLANNGAYLTASGWTRAGLSVALPLAAGTTSVPVAFNTRNDILARATTATTVEPEIWAWLPAPPESPEPGGGHYEKRTLTLTLPSNRKIDSFAPSLTTDHSFTGRIKPDRGGQTEPVIFAKIGLSADLNRDGSINPDALADYATAETPLGFTVNDDDDNPGVTPQSDYLSGTVDGTDDLKDFVPVFLNIRGLLQALPNATVKLKQADGALNFVYTSLTRATAFDYQNAATATTGYGPSANQAAAGATTQQITAAGVTLSEAFLARIRANGEGVILVEARQLSGAPLTLVVENAGVQIPEVNLHMTSLRLYADPGKVHLGFDPPNKSEGDAPNEYWASVVQGSTNTILNLDLPPSAIAGVKWTVATADTARVDISPKTFTSVTTKLAITGLSSSLDAPYEATITLVPIVSTGPAILTLKILVVPQRTPLSVGFFVIEDSASSGTQFASSPSIPLPNFTAIRDILNDTFKQAGVSFVVSANSGVYPEPYDTHRLIQNGGETSEVIELGQDGQLSQTEYQNNLPFDDAKYAADIQIFILKNSGRPYYSINPNLNYPHLRIRGSNPSFPFRDIMLFARETVGYMDTAIAHEIGHKLGLAVNPDSTFPGSGHDDPPYSLAVAADLPNGATPPSMGSDFLPHPNRVLMQSGWPIDGKMPWTHGRWMKHEDWKMANDEALRIKR